MSMYTKGYIDGLRAAENAARRASASIRVNPGPDGFGRVAQAQIGALNALADCVAAIIKDIPNGPAELQDAPRDPAPLAPAPAAAAVA